MGDLVEKVARAIVTATGEWDKDVPALPWESLESSERYAARFIASAAIAAVLAAIAEPSDAMQLAGHNMRNDPQTGLPTSCGIDEIYRAMIAALKEEVGE